MNKSSFVFGACFAVAFIFSAFLIITAIDDHFRINRLAEKCKALADENNALYRRQVDVENRLRETRQELGLEKKTSFDGWYTASFCGGN